MSKFRSMVNEVAWILGVICLAGGLLLRLLALGHIYLAVSPRGSFLLAAVLFLCTLATGELGKAPAGG
jgi:hypothetical protein